MVPTSVPRLQSAARLLRASSDAFVTFLSALPAEDAVAATPDRWSPAAHASHVALTDNVFTAAIAGTGPLKVFGGESEIPETTWNFNVPPVIAAPPILVPRADVSREAAIAQITDAAATLAEAIERLDPARTLLCVQLPWAVVSMTQMCEWAGGHTLRHLSLAGREIQQAAARSLVR